MSKENIKDAAKSFADFNTFASIKAMLENGVVYTRKGLDSADIVIGCCDDAMKSLLAEFDSKTSK